MGVTAEVNILGEVYTLDCSKFSLADYLEGLEAESKGDSQKRLEIYSRISAKVLGDQAEHVPMIYMPFFIPVIMEKILEYVATGSVQDELTDIASMLMDPPENPWENPGP